MINNLVATSVFLCVLSGSFTVALEQSQCPDLNQNPYQPLLFLPACATRRVDWTRSAIRTPY